MVSSIKRIADRKGKTMAFVTLEDFSGQVEVVVFADACEAAGEDLTGDAVVVVSGRVSTRENEEAKVVASSLMALERGRRELGGALEIELEADTAAELAPVLDSVLARYPGSGQIIFKIRGEAGDSIRILAKRRQVALTSDLIRELGELVGQTRVRLRRREPVRVGE
jgi:DNA polymerase-3 subunit alpha